MAGLDRYLTFGVREEWLETYSKYGGDAEFWITDGDLQVPNKKKEAFKNFVIDAGIAVYDKTTEGDKFSKCVPTEFGRKICELGGTDATAWVLILCNLVYTPTYNWFINNLNMGVSYSPEAIKDMLGFVMENDTKGLGRRNILDALKITLSQTPLGKNRIFADFVAEEKNGRITLKSVERCKWEEPIPEVILYSLYKFAEKCGDYYQFTLDTLLDDEIERDGVSPTKIFGLGREEMISILNGLSINYPDFISASFTLDLDNITLRTDKTSNDVLRLF